MQQCISFLFAKKTSVIMKRFYISAKRKKLVSRRHTEHLFNFLQFAKKTTLIMRGRETIFQRTVESGKPEPLIYFLKGVNMSNTYYVIQKKKSYGFFKFCGDVLLTCITGGFWLIWIFVREMRKAR